MWNGIAGLTCAEVWFVSLMKHLMFCTHVRRFPIQEVKFNANANAMYDYTMHYNYDQSR